MNPTVVLRSHNDMPLAEETLAALARQNRTHALAVFDNASTDGTLEAVSRHTDRIVQVPAGEYIPGRVLNQAMEQSDGEFVVFLNADCTPLGEGWLDRLLAGFDHPSVAAVYGRQVARTGCDPLEACDLERTYGPSAAPSSRRHVFSMAAAAIRRSVWEDLRFDERLDYSEDIDWTWRARQRGNVIRYVPDAVAAHSHNYSLRALWRRHWGEGRAEAHIFDFDSAWKRSAIRYALLPWGRQVLGDWVWCLRRGALGAALRSPIYRLTMWTARLRGLREGPRNMPS